MAAYLANVGATAAHRPASTRLADGSFVLAPIPEPVPWRPPMLRYRDLPELSAPASWLDRAVHADPDLTGRPATYGDNCRTAGRAYSLRRAEPGDVIVFAARLDGAIHLVGALEVDAILRDAAADPGAGWWDANAHLRRARATSEWNRFWVFRGTARSGLFARAVPLDRRLAESLIPIAWHPRRTEQQSLASHTRAVRRLEAEPETLLRSLWLAQTSPS
jgi:Nucleotide modification associated domain 3